MKMERVNKPEFQMQFTADEGWVIIGALKQYIVDHPHAGSVKDWKDWVHRLDNLLRGNAR